MDAVIKKVKSVTKKERERFWAKVDKSGECWEWQAATIKGYGYACLQTQNWLAHRLAWFLTFGYQPNLFVLHSCDNPKCVNPAHLREGTQQENMRDRVSRDRSAKGESHGSAKLSVEQVKKIRFLRENQKFSKTKLASLFGVARSTIRRIIDGQGWAHVE